MKVLVLSHMYPSSANEVAGIFVHKQVKELMKKGVEIRVVSPKPMTPFPINYLNPKWRNYSKIPRGCVWEEVETYYPRYVAIPRAMFFATSGYRMYYGIRRTVDKLYQEFAFDLIHAHVALPDGYAGALLARDFGKPLVITIHGQDFQKTVHRDDKCKAAIRSALQNAFRVMVVSKKLRRLAVKHFNIHNKLVVIPNGVAPEDIGRVGGIPERSNNENIILSVSNLVSSKGIDLNIDAIKQLKDKYPQLQYWVVGSGPEENKLRGLTARYGLENRVKFLGRQPHGDALKYMAACDLFSLPSWSEGFGVAYLEAMALGKPVIGCQGEGPADFVKHGKTGLLVKPHDLDSLVEALDFLLSHPKKARTMGERARKLVLVHYTWEKNAEKTMQVYHEVLNEG
ncbi:MAG: glycosyltransferase family 4 protein [Dethiobacteria bacterium]|nr:glycosyltransferase family 4 protein [Acholeplasmataceae bacterium]